MRRRKKIANTAPASMRKPKAAVNPMRAFRWFFKDVRVEFAGFKDPFGTGEAMVVDELELPESGQEAGVAWLIRSPPAI